MRRLIGLFNNQKTNNIQVTNLDQIDSPTFDQTASTGYLADNICQNQRFQISANLRFAKTFGVEVALKRKIKVIVEKVFLKHHLITALSDHFTQ